MEQTNSPSVVPLSDIPIDAAAAGLGLEVRPFLAHEILSSILPPSAVALAWTHAPAGSDVALRSHPTRGLLIVLEGRAKLKGGLRRAVEAGDVITLPSHHEYGFSEVGEGGLHALHVAFPDEQASSSNEARTFEELLARNEARIQVALNNPFFALLRNRRIDSAGKRATMCECLRVFADAFQTFLFTRQATCRDDEYAALFHEHLVEELGHNKLLATSGKSPIARDPVLRATASWFCHQMLVLDNAEKAIVNLVLESAGYYLGTLAGPQFEGQISASYFATHGEDDARHRELGMQLLEGHHAQTYARLQRVLDSSWDMLDAMTRRFAHIIELGTKSS
jgi:mannose-6-phosphate isomerase-like protein (cupin superfamily)